MVGKSRRAYEDAGIILKATIFDIERILCLRSRDTHNSQKHKQFVGVGNELILENSLRLMGNLK